MKDNTCRGKMLPSSEYLAQCFDYDPQTGLITRKSRPESHFRSRKAFLVAESRFAGKAAGNINSAGYLLIGLDGSTYLAHRIAWKLMHGDDPDYIDHINGFRTDNRIDNLRNTTCQQNQSNKALSKKSSTNIYGVTICSHQKAFRVYITQNYKRHFLGSTKDFLEACCLRKSAENTFGFHENHGRKRAMNARRER